MFIPQLFCFLIMMLRSKMAIKKQIDSLICPFCKKLLPDKLIVSEAARINGRKGGRKLTSTEARKMQKKRKTKMTSEEASRIAKIRWDKRKQK